MNEVTQLLQAIERGDAKSADQLLPLVYEELRKLAASKMARETPGQTLQPTALVHEAWLRLVGGSSPRFNDHAHFFGAAAEAMRRILIDRARRKAAQRHGGGLQRVDIDEIEIAAPAPDDELLAVNDALDRFAALDAPKAQLVKLRFFAGLTLDQAAGVLGVSEPTAKRWWAYARAWLFEECKAARAHPGGA
jgi:RNA polymerase sigma factor (TIGR02999 family)